MLGTDIRGIIAEEEEVQRRKDALKSLLSMRSKQLRESLEQRIKRARTCGDWIQLSQEECATLHKREKLHLKSQFDKLQHEQDRTRGKLTALKRAKARAQRIRAAEAASGRNAGPAAKSPPLAAFPGPGRSSAPAPVAAARTFGRISALSIAPAPNGP